MKASSKFFLFFLIICTACTFNTAGHFDKDVAFSPASELQRKRIIRAINNSSKNFKTARVKSLLHLQSSVFNASFTFSAVAALPSQIRIELFTPGFPKLLNLLVVNETRVAMYDAKQGKTLASDDSLKLVEDTLGLPLSAAELLYLSVGKINLDLIDLDLINGFKLLVDSKFEDTKLFSLRVNDRVNDKVFFAHLSDCGEEIQKVKILNAQYLSNEKVFLNAKYNYSSKVCREVPEKIEFEITKESLLGEFSKIKFQENPDIEKNRSKIFTLPN